MRSNFLNPEGVNQYRADVYAFKCAVQMYSVCPVIGEKVSQQMY